MARRCVALDRKLKKVKIFLEFLTTNHTNQEQRTINKEQSSVRNLRLDFMLSLQTMLSALYSLFSVHC